MDELNVSIFVGDQEIGTAVLRPSDPSMGVAGGVFRPNAVYSPTLHSGPKVAELTAREPSGSLVQCAGVSIEDYAEDLGDEGRQVYVLGMDTYGTYFGGT
ncbi:hypothetical protein [Caulobacter sp. 17J80-11]|uniref:hypothetical protein n=1 Tax=Caulobacter sp. 17J80-11 TaxID=2763502 RepID=UPI001653A0EF|nr:hypothetical protein [Caulobacter sp. 17J80-11]MBC6981175.1 hypothetical protein [Caulobacter sp. 17J80-11]